MTILIYISCHKRNLATRVRFKTGLSVRPIRYGIELLLKLGLIRSSIVKVQTNIPGLVPFTAYTITAEGKKTIEHLNDLLHENAL